jgi:osmoprotectant transport system permease protein
VPVSEFLTMLQSRLPDILAASRQHLWLSMIALFGSVLIAVPLGIMLTRYKKLAGPVMGVVSVFQTIPSLALLGFMIPLFGIGPVPAVIAMVMYALLPILRNTYTGILEVDPALREAGRGMGMTRGQMLRMVELPLARSMIFAGVRTAAVMTIGVATLASFIGAGGLGDLILRGISSSDTGAILAGAIPAAVMAVLLDFLLAWLDRSVTPKGLRVGGGKQRSPRREKMRKVMVAIVSLALIAAVGMSGVMSTQASDSIVVVGKNFTEQDILAYLVGALIENNTDAKVQVKSYLGGTEVAFGALKSGDADIYVEYTGTGLVNILNEKVVPDPDQVYDKVKKEFHDRWQLEWLKPIGFNNTYAIAVTQETAKKYGLKKVSDLQKVASQLTMGTEQEFLDRPDGLPGMLDTYGLKFRDVKAMDPGLKYTALTSDQVQLIDAFSTDGRIIKNHLVLLEDDQHFFPPYYAAPMVRGEILKKYPELKDVLNKLAGKINEEEMAKMNAEVEVDKKPAREVAEAWLKKEGLIR